MIFHSNSFTPTVRNLRYINNLIQKTNSCISSSHLFCSNPVFNRTHELFDEITQRSCNLLNLKCGLSHIAANRRVFDDFFSWSNGISESVKKKQYEQAVSLFRSMLLHDQRPNYVTLLSVIRAVGGLNQQEMTFVVHAFVLKLGVGSEVSIATALLGSYSAHNDMIMVRQIFDCAQVKDLVFWSALVKACSKNGKFSDAVDAFREMQVLGWRPNYVSILSILPACADFGVLSLGKQIHGFCLVREIYTVTNIQNSLIDMYAKCGVIRSAVRIFDRLQNKDLVSWKTMICGCTENGYPKEALNILRNMLKSSYKPDETIVRNVLLACSQAEEAQFGYGLHCFSVKSGLEESASVGTALLRMYADFGDIVSSRVLFDCLRWKDVIAWSAMISVYAKTGKSFLAFEMFWQMQLANEEPNEITLVSLLQACSSMKSQELGKVIHANVLRNGYSSNVFVTSALIDLYCKFGQLTQGEALFDAYPYKDIICWSSMINGYGINGFGDKALETFSKMLDTGKKPNGVVFISVLSACSHCGLEDEGWKWFYSMKEQYGITPALSHYSCMADLLSRKGKIEEAFRFIKEMPLAPDASIWGSLLAGCKTVRGYVEIAEFAAERLLTLDPENTSYYVILSNIYADVGQWKDVERLRRVLEEKKLRKTVGFSMVGR